MSDLPGRRSLARARRAPSRVRLGGRIDRLDRSTGAASCALIQWTSACTSGGWPLRRPAPAPCPVRLQVGRGGLAAKRARRPAGAARQRPRRARAARAMRDVADQRRDAAAGGDRPWRRSASAPARRHRAARKRAACRAPAARGEVAPQRIWSGPAPSGSASSASTTRGSVEPRQQVSGRPKASAAPAPRIVLADRLVRCHAPRGKRSPQPRRSAQQRRRGDAAGEHAQARAAPRALQLHAGAAAARPGTRPRTRSAVACARAARAVGIVERQTAASAKTSVAPRLAGCARIALDLDRPALDGGHEHAAPVAVERQRGGEAQRHARAPAAPACST